MTDRAMESNSNPFFSDANEFTNMLLSGLLDGLNFGEEGLPSNLEGADLGERSSLAKEVLQKDLMSGPSRNGSCSDAASPSTVCSDDDIHAAIRANWSAASQELCQAEDSGVILERLVSNYSRLSSEENSEKISTLIASRRESTRKPSEEDDGGSPVSSPSSIHLNPEIQAAIKMASITIYQGLVRHVDRYNDPALKDGNIVLCIDPTRKHLQNESCVQASADTPVWSDTEGTGTPPRMSPSGNVELTVDENERQKEIKSLNPSPQGEQTAEVALELGPSPCQELGFDLPKEPSPELESGSDLCKYSSPELESSFDMRKDSSPELETGVDLAKDSTEEPESGFDLRKDSTPEPSEQDAGLQMFCPTSPCVDDDIQQATEVNGKDVSKSPSPLPPEEQNADETADACEAFYLQDEEEADDDMVYKSLSPSPPDEEDAAVTAVSLPMCEGLDLTQDVSQDEDDIIQDVKALKSLSPSPGEEESSNETMVPISTSQEFDLVEDVEPNDQVSKSLTASPCAERLQDSTPVLSPGQGLDNVEDVEQEKESESKSLSSSPTKEAKDDETPVLTTHCDGVDLEVEKDGIIAATSRGPLSSEPRVEQEIVTTPALISPCRDDLLDDHNSDVERKTSCLSPQKESTEQILEASESIPETSESIPENPNDIPKATMTPEKISPDQDPVEDGHETEEGTLLKLKSSPAQEEPSGQSSLSPLEEIVLHKDSGDETQQKKAPLILEEYFNAAMKKFSNTLLDALISHLESYKDPKTGIPLPVRVKSEKPNFSWNQEQGETENAKQDGEESSSQSTISGLQEQDSPCETL